MVVSLPPPPLAPPYLFLSTSFVIQKLRVLISMELEGVTNVQPADDHYEYFFTVSRQLQRCQLQRGQLQRGVPQLRINVLDRAITRHIHPIAGHVRIMSRSPLQDCQLEPKGISQRISITKNLLITEQKHQDEHEISGSKGKANFVWRCSNCKVWNVPHKTLRYAEI